ncbi:MAG TPA: transcriptional regulator [Microcoleaceae cyanobacterium]
MVGERQEPDSIANSGQPGQTSNGDLASMSETSSQALAAKPLAVILSASAKEMITPGSVFSLSVTISNKGRQSAIIDVLIDARSTRLQQWCLSSLERLALGPDHSGEVVFPIRVPHDALPGIYPYEVIVDAQEHYPEDTPIQFAQQIQVLPATQDVVHTSDPTFVLQPVTTPQSPAVIQPGGALAVQVLVHNRSDRVDRFRLVCTDLPPSWFSIVYPQGVQGSGLVVATDSLNLNPGEQSLISLIFNPPIDALAGSYIPTLRLYSANNPELVLLDLLYLQVPPVYLLQIELRTLISRVRQQAGIYQVRLNNLGNTQREVMLRCQNLDESDLCTYTLDRTQVQIAPREWVGVALQVQPKKWWRRPLFGGGRVLNFSVDLEDPRQLPLTVDHLPGFLLWEARPWWQILPLVLLGILGILAIAYLLWWWLFRIPPSPQIVQFFSEDPAYTAANDDVVRLGWQISEPQRLQSLQITGLSPEGAPLTRPEVYDWSQGVPAVLQPFCTQTATELECRNVRTSARKPGTYQFELVVRPQAGRGGATAVTSTTKPVTIAPLPQPNILAFTSTQPAYQEPPGGPKTQAESQPTKATNSEIQLNWAIANPTQLRSLQLIGRTTEGVVVSPPQQYDFSQGLPSPLKEQCELKVQLICQNISTKVKQPGDYVFELTAISKTVTSDKPITQKTDVIKILPKPPRILEFTLNGKPALPKYVIPITRDQPLPNLLLSWQIDASVGSKVELLPAPGNVPLKAAIPLILSPQPGSVTVVLQVTSPTGQQITRSVIFETVDPTDPVVAAAAATAKAIAEAQQAAEAKKEAAGQASGAAPGLNSPTPSVPGTLSPVELPPQFDRR